MLRQLQLVEEAEPVLDRKVRELTDILVPYLDGKVLVTKPFSLAHRALHLAHVLVYLVFGILAGGLSVTALEIVHNALKGRAVCAAAQ